MLVKFLLPSGQIREQGSTREGKGPWPQEVETQGLVQRREGRAHSRSLGQPWVVPFSEFATFFVAIRAKKIYEIGKL